MFYFFIMYVLIGIVMATLLCKIVNDNLEEFKLYVGDENFEFYQDYQWLIFPVLVFTSPLYYTYQFTVWFIKYLFGLTLKLFGGKK